MEAEQAQLPPTADHSIKAWRPLALKRCLPARPVQLTLSPLNFSPSAVVSVQGPALTRCTREQGSRGGRREARVQVREGRAQFPRRRHAVAAVAAALTTPSPVTLRQRSQVEGGSGGRARAARPAWVLPVQRARMSSSRAMAATRRRETGCMAGEWNVLGRGRGCREGLNGVEQGGAAALNGGVVSAA